MSNVQSVIELAENMWDSYAIELEDMLEYLDELRISGVTNMFGAGAFLEEEFGMSRKDARDVLLFWMETFGERNGDR